MSRQPGLKVVTCWGVLGGRSSFGAGDAFCSSGFASGFAER